MLSVFLEGRLVVREGAVGGASSRIVRQLPHDSIFLMKYEVRSSSPERDP